MREDRSGQGSVDLTKVGGVGSQTTDGQMSCGEEGATFSTALGKQE